MCDPCGQGFLTRSRLCSWPWPADSSRETTTPDQPSADPSVVEPVAQAAEPRIPDLLPSDGEHHSEGVGGISGQAYPYTEFKNLRQTLGSTSAQLLQELCKSQANGNDYNYLNRKLTKDGWLRLQAEAAT